MSYRSYMEWIKNPFPRVYYGSKGWIKNDPDGRGA